jgi:hypothetical protein
MVKKENKKWSKKSSKSDQKKVVKNHPKMVKIIIQKSLQ